MTIVKCRGSALFPSPFALSRKRERGTVGVALRATVGT
jgi:hypothetical protein